MKKILALILAVTTMMTVAGCSGTTNDTSATSDDVKVWRFCHEESVGSVQDQFAMKFKELVEEKSGGKIRVDVYPVGQLADGVGAIELLRYNAVNFAINNPATVATIIPENQLLMLHYVFSDDMEVNRKALNEGNATKELDRLYTEKDMIPLNWFQEGFQVVTSNFPIYTPEDMNGFKIRVMASPLLIAAYSAYGCNPTPVPYMETYSNLQLNMIDGQVNPVFAIEEMKFYEVQEYLNFLNHEVFIGTFCTNPEFWESLTEEEKTMVMEIQEELDQYVFDMQNQYSQERLEKILANKPSIELIEYTDEERAAFQEKAQAGYDYYLDLTGEEGQKLLNMLQEDIAAAEKEVNQDI